MNIAGFTCTMYSVHIYLWHYTDGNDGNYCFLLFFRYFFKEALTEKLTVALPEAEEVSKVSGKA
jgi:hypothetical protein